MNDGSGSISEAGREREREREGEIKTRHHFIGIPLAPLSCEP